MRRHLSRRPRLTSDFSGLARESFLYARPKNRIDDIRVDANLDDSYTDGILSVEADIKGAGALTLVLSDESGKTVAEAEVNNARGKVRKPLKSPIRRSGLTETPNLYRLTSYPEPWRRGAGSDSAQRRFPPRGGQGRASAGKRTACAYQRCRSA